MSKPAPPKYLNTRNNISTKHRQNFENIINGLIEANHPNTDVRFKFISKHHFDSLPFLKTSWVDILKETGFIDKRDKNFKGFHPRYMVSALCMVSKLDYNRDNYTNPYTILVIDEVFMQSKPSIQILFGINHPDYKSSIKLFDASLNVNLRMILMTWAKWHEYSYITTEAVTFSSQRVSNKLGFTPVGKIRFPETKHFDFVAAYELYNHLRNANPDINIRITPDDLLRYSNSRNSISKLRNYNNPINIRNFKTAQAFVMKYKNSNIKVTLNGTEQPLKDIFRREIAENESGSSYLFNAQGSQFAQPWALNFKGTPEYNNTGYGYRPYRGTPAFTYYYPLNKLHKARNRYYDYIVMQARQQGVKRKRNTGSTSSNNLNNLNNNNNTRSTSSNNSNNSLGYNSSNNNSSSKPYTNKNGRLILRLNPGTSKNNSNSNSNSNSNHLL